ncbi:MAG: hypothetical protein LAT82_01545 [Nanoarchaeota archaeon]|nr:hypothetical protein [Nanoarchaeota archaeon]
MEDIDRKKEVEKEIENLIDEFKKNSDKFLTEEDLRSYLYHLLLDKFGKLKKTKSNSSSIELHSEVRWYGENKGLKYRSDLVIFDVSTLETKSRSTKLPSKGYGFNNPYIIIELKLRRINGSSDKKFFESLINDRNKLNEIKNSINNPKLYTYLIGFDKKLSLNSSKFKLESNDFHKEYYIKSNK